MEPTSHKQCSRKQITENMGEKKTDCPVGTQNTKHRTLLSCSQGVRVSKGCNLFMRALQLSPMYIYLF